MVSTSSTTDGPRLLLGPRGLDCARPARRVVSTGSTTGGPRLLPGARGLDCARPPRRVVSTRSTCEGHHCFSAPEVSTDRSLRSLLDQRGSPLLLGSPGLDCARPARAPWFRQAQPPGVTASARLTRSRLRSTSKRRGLDCARPAGTWFRQAQPAWGHGCSSGLPVSTALDRQEAGSRVRSTDSRRGLDCARPAGTWFRHAQPAWGALLLPRLTASRVRSTIRWCDSDSLLGRMVTFHVAQLVDD